MPCPECVKVILNGGGAARVLDGTMDAFDAYIASGGEFKDADLRNFVLRANKLEEDVYAFQKRFLESIGVKGPWPKSMA